MDRALGKMPRLTKLRFDKALGVKDGQVVRAAFLRSNAAMRSKVYVFVKDSSSKRTRRFRFGVSPGVLSALVFLGIRRIGAASSFAMISMPSVTNGIHGVVGIIGGEAAMDNNVPTESDASSQEREGS